MPYTKRPDILTVPGYLVVELDTGALVAVACERKRVARGIAYHAVARAVDATGADLAPPVMTEHTHSASMEELGRLGDDAIAADMLRAVLGEPPVAIPWSDVVLGAASIRLSLAADPLQGATDADALL